MSQGRSVWRLLVQNFINSLKIRPPVGRCVGEDSLGNKYYEILEGYKTSRKHPHRWFKPKVEDDWQQDLPAEWEAWLRHRRNDPPTTEEVMQNAAIAQMKKEKGDEIRKKSEAERGITGGIQFTPLSKGFPSLEGYENDPRKNREKKRF